MQDDKEPLPFTEDEDLIETYDNQHLVSIPDLLCYQLIQISNPPNKCLSSMSRLFMDFQTEKKLPIFSHWEKQSSSSYSFADNESGDVYLCPGRTRKITKYLKLKNIKCFIFTALFLRQMPISTIQDVHPVEACSSVWTAVEEFYLFLIKQTYISC